MQKLRVLGHGLMLAGALGATPIRATARYPQEALPQQKISFCGHRYLAWVAKSAEERNRGLMNFRPLRAHEAMIFIFPEPEPLSFWMKNVPYDLDIAFFSKKKKLLNFLTMQGTSPMVKDEHLPAYKSAGDALYAVEVAGGSLKPSPGCTLSLD